MDLADTLAEELCLEKWQFEERSGATSIPKLRQEYLEVDCLVHSDWIGCIESPGLHLPRNKPPFSREDVHWMLQPSCWSATEPPWQRVHVCCLKKQPGKHRSRYLVPRPLGSTDSIHAFLTCIAHDTMLSYWKDFETRLDKTNFSEGEGQDEVGGGRPSQLPPQHLSALFLSQVVKALFNKQLRPLIPTTPPKDHTQTATPTLHSPSLVIDKSDKKATGQENLTPLLSAIESDNAFYLIYKYNRFTLFDCISHSPAMLDNSSKPMFVVYQLLKLLSHCHGNGITLGDINLKNIYVDGRLWVQYYLPPDALVLPLTAETTPSPKNSTPNQGLSSGSETREECVLDTTKSTANPVGHTPPPSLSLADAVANWRSGHLSNYDYIMLLNYHAGRRMGDPNNHPIFPWVTDFERKNGNLRDLSCSKHRLAKGDIQLDFTYSSSTNELMRRSPTTFGSVVPHHIGDIASDVTYYVYKARQTSKDVLCSRVRPNWVPEQYPASIEKMYAWTPDEAIPEFYTSPELFHSIHPDLPDLKVPDWCSSPEEFIRIHRNLLEGDQVSATLNHWIDLTFGSKLSGEAAVKAKNVYLSLVDGHTSLSNSGIVQLFRSSHPKRLQTSSAPFVISQWQRYLAMSSLMNLTSFDIPFIGSHRRTNRPGSAEDEGGKSFSALLHETNLCRSPDLRGTKGSAGIDDGSFEHVPYPTEVDDTLVPVTPEHSYYPNEGYYEAGMLNKPANKGTGTNRVTSEVGVASDQSNKLLRGILRSKRAASMEVSSEAFEWQVSSINLPPTSHPLQPITDVEDLGFFLNKSCHDYGQMCQRWWKPPDLLMLEKTEYSLSNKIADLLHKLEEEGALLSYEDRVILDLVAVVCVAMEITANKYIRSTLPIQGSLKKRYSSIRHLLINGRLMAPHSLQPLTEVIFMDKLNDSSSKLLDIFPTVNSSLLIQQFIPLISFPGYFDRLYNTASEMESRSKLMGVSISPVKQRHTQYKLPTEEQVKDSSELISFVLDQSNDLFPTLDQEGITLLLMYIQPLFEHSVISFEAVSTLFEPISQFLSRRVLQQSFLIPFLNVFDNISNPVQRYNVLNRRIASILIASLGLSTFLSRYLHCFIEAVIEPMGHNMTETNQLPKQQVSFLKDASEDNDLSLSHRLDLSHASNPLSPSSSTTTKHSLHYSWREEHGIHSDDEEDSEGEEDFNYPDVSLLETKSTPVSSVSVFGLLADIEETDCQSDLDTSLQSPINKKDSEPSVTVSGRRDSDAPRRTTLGRKECSSTSLSAPKPSRKHSKSELDQSTSQAMPTRPLPLRQSSSLEDDIDDDNSDLLPPTISVSAVRSFPVLPITEIDNYSDRMNGQEEEEVEKDDVPMATTAVDPHLLAMSQRISEVASDCLIWLLWRLGPLLSTKHIVRPLLDSFHRCFTSMTRSEGSNGLTHAKSALAIMVSVVDYYGQETIASLYVPFVKQQITGLLKRSTVTIKAESCLAASIGVLEVIVKRTFSCETLLALMEDLSSSYFQPLLNLLCSNRHVFPSGSEARMALCYSLVQLLKHACARLGPSRSSEVLMDVLKCFFCSYSTAHGKETPSANNFSPVEGYFGLTEEITHTTSAQVVPDDLNLIAVKQVLDTFPADFVHETYVHFCKVIGQIQMSRHLQNVEAIEDLHALYSEQMGKTSRMGSCVLSLLYLDDQEMLETSTNSEGSSDASGDFELTYRLGPSQAHQGRMGLGRDSIGFGRPSWFVEMDDSPTPTGIVSGGPHATPSQIATTNQANTTLKRGGGVVGSGHPTPHHEGGGQGQFNAVDNQLGTLDRSSAIFEAKFKPLANQSADLNTTGSSIYEEIGSDIDCTLHGEWTKLWSYQAFRDKKYDSYEQFEGIKLQTYSGHRSAVKSMCVVDSEHMFISGSKDRTVKIWSLYNQGDGSATLSPSLTYSGHQKPVNKVHFVNSLQNVVSCDGSVHLWDIETSYCLQQFLPSKPTTQFLTMDSVGDSPHQLVVSTSDFNLRFIDLRTRAYQHTWRTFFPAGGSMRFLSSHGNWVAIGNVNGMINVFDLRTGELNYHWKLSEKWLLPQSGWSETLVHLTTTPRGNILTSAGAGLVSLWKPNSKPLNHFRGQTVSTPCLEVYGDQLLTVASNGSVLVHGSFEYSRDNVISNSRLKMKGSVTCSAAAPLNQLLLLGNDTGQITLMA